MAGRNIQTNIVINAPAARVWSALTDFTTMPAWNPFIRSISGTLTQGARLSVRLAAPGKTPMRFRPTVLSVQPERELRWLGHLVIPGLFDGEHYFLINPINGGKVDFIHGENFSGLLVRFLGGTLSAAEAGFSAMNAALKEKVEREASP
jgi:hypothetical protein